MKFAFSNFGEKSEWMVDDGYFDIEVEEEVDFEQIYELKPDEGWQPGPIHYTPIIPDGYFAFELDNYPGDYYVSRNAANIIKMFAYESSEGYAPSWIVKPEGATRNIIRKVIKTFYW